VGFPLDGVLPHRQQATEADTRPQQRYAALPLAVPQLDYAMSVIVVGMSQWSFRKIGTAGTLASQAEIDAGSSTRGASAVSRGITSWDFF